MGNKIWKNKKGVAPVIETMTALCITFTILILFFFSISNLFTAYTNRTDIDLQAKCLNICEKLINSPGTSASYNYNWDDMDPSIQSIMDVGLAATQTMDYGYIEYDDSLTSYSTTFLGDSQGLPSSCFLEGTQILMADENYKNIEEVNINDFVKAFDIERGEIVNVKVINVFHHAPNEMTDYYLVINNFLKVTPNHKIHMDGKWISFADIKVGDAINNNYVHSVEKVFDKMPTFDLEIEKYHNYFVRLNNNVILAHNLDPQDPTPWVLTTKSIIESNDFSSYGGDYYVEFGPKILDYDEVKDELYVFEVKKKTLFSYPVLDAKKIEFLQVVDYADAKSALGLGLSTYAYYNFHISIQYESGYVVNFGALFGETEAVDIATFTRNILIYHQPEISKSDPADIIVDPPYYEDGQITVRVFLGGSSPIFFNYRKPITIHPAKVEADFSNFPVLVSVIDTDIQSHVSSGEAQSNGNDIVFTDYYGNKLNHEIEYFDGSSGELVAWVNVPSLSENTETKLWMYYGNMLCPNQENVEETWDDNYLMVQHLEEGSGLIYDSTINDNDGSKQGDATFDSSGKIYGGYAFDGNMDYINLPDIVEGLSDITVSAWVQSTVADDSGTHSILSQFSSGQQNALWLKRGWQEYYMLSLYDQDQNFGYVWTKDAESFYPDTDWHYVVGTASGTNIKLYVDEDTFAGVPESYSGTIEDVTNSDLVISIDDATQGWQGYIDEVRISNIARSPEWIKTSFNNQDDPLTFLSFGAEEELS